MFHCWVYLSVQAFWRQSGSIQEERGATNNEKMRGKERFFPSSTFSPWLLLLHGCLRAAGNDHQEYKMKLHCRHSETQVHSQKCQEHNQGDFPAVTLFWGGAHLRDHSFGGFEPLSLSAALYKKTTTQCTNWCSVIFWQQRLRSERTF